MSGADDDNYVAYVTARLPVLRRAATQLVGDAHRGDDLVQQAITRLYLHWRRVRELENLDAYVYKILMRVFLDERRLRWSAVRLRPAPAGDEPADDPTATVADRLLLRQGLATLPPRQRAVLVLRYLHDRPVDEVAQILDVSPGTVKSQAHDGLGALRRFYEEELPVSTVDVQGAVRDGQRGRRRRTDLTAGAVALVLVAVAALAAFALRHPPSPGPAVPTPTPTAECGRPTTAREEQPSWQRFDPLRREIDARGVTGYHSVMDWSAANFQVAELSGTDGDTMWVMIFACDAPVGSVNDSGVFVPFDPTAAEPTEPVNGASAYWSGKNLFWQWAPGAWAMVLPATVDTTLTHLRAAAARVAPQLVLGVGTPVAAPFSLPAPDGLHLVYTLMSHEDPTVFVIAFDNADSVGPVDPYGRYTAAVEITASPAASEQDRPADAPPYPDDLGYPAYQFEDSLLVYDFGGMGLRISPLADAAAVLQTITAYPGAIWGPPVLS